MKRTPLSLRPIALLLALSAMRVHAGSATWNGSAGDGDWLNSANWTPASVPGTGDTATFGAAPASVVGVGISLLNLNFAPAAVASTVSGTLTIENNGSVTVGAGSAVQTVSAAPFAFAGNATLTNNADTANALALSGGIVLPLAVGSTFTFDGSGVTNVSSVNSGAASASVLTKIVKNGSGTVQFASSNTGIGGTANGDGITINAGTLKITNQNAASNRVINLNGGTLECAANNANSQYTRMHVSADSRLFYSIATNQWQLGNSSTGTLVSTGNPVLTLDGTVNGASASALRLNFPTNAFTGTWAISNKAIVRLANVNTGGGGVTLDFGSGTGTHIVESLATFQDGATQAIKPIPFGALKGTATDSILRGRQNTGTQTTGTQYRIGIAGVSTSYAGIIADGTATNGSADGTGATLSNGASGPQATTELVKEGTGTLTLAGTANTYTGGTILAGGILEIAADSSLGAAYDGTLRPFSMIPGSGTFTALPTASISGGGGTGAVVNVFSSTNQPTTANTYFLTFGATSGVNNQTGSGYTSNPTVTITTAAGNPPCAASVRVKGLLTFDGGTLRTNAGLTSGRATVLTANNGTIDTNGFDSTLSGTVGGVGGLTKAGAGRLTIGNATFAGATSVNAGTLVLNGSLSSAITVAAGATLGGGASTTGAVTVDGTISPGASVGALSTGALTLGGGASCAFEVSDWAGAAGTGFDTVNAASLDITAGAGNPVTVNVSELALANFDGTSKSFTLVSTAGGITGFAADKFVVNTAGFTSGAGPWSVAVSGNNLVLNYTGSASPYDTWASGFGLAGASADKAGDPDKDGVTNLAEFAFNSSPVAGALPGGPNAGGIQSVSGSDALTLTIRVRSGAVFSGAAELSATKDGVIYRVQGSTNLSTWTADIDEVTPALATGLPAPDAGWEYRTFRIAGPVSSSVRAQIRCIAE